MLLEVGQTYAGRYRIARKLGEGAMGAVYEAEHILIHRRVALKVLHSTVAERHGALHRFEREAQAAGRIGSPHIVEVLDMGDLAAAGAEAGTARFIVMELLEGETLAERRDACGRLHPEDVASLACQVLAGLGAAHAADIVHRDLKPANVFLVRGRGGGDFVKILDFGVSKFNTPGDDMSATAPGAALGTPYYMSPEQAKGSQRIDARSDLYSVGVMLYECVTGQVPFDAGTFNELIFRIVLESPPPLESFVPEADPAFVAIVRKAMAREPGDRYQSAREFHDALAQWLLQTTGQHAARGVLPWDGTPYVPSASGSGLPRGPSTEMALEHAQTRLFVPRRKRSLGTVVLGLALLGVIAGASLLLVLGARSGDGAPVAAARLSIAPTASMASSAPPAVSSTPPPAAPPPTVTASATAPPAHAIARPAAPKRPGPAPPPPVPHRRTVPSEL